MPLTQSECEIIEETSVNCPICGLKKRYSIHICPKNQPYSEVIDVISEAN
jgi:hypothetical protein